MEKEKQYEFYRGNIQSSDGSTRLEGYFYAPTSAAPRAVIQICHGMTEYIGRYEPLAAALCPLGYIVCGHDALGHGRSAATPKDRGFFAPRDGADYLVEDTFRFTCLVRQSFENLPVILFGFSMGSFIVRNYMKRYRGDADAYIVCGTAGPEAPAGLGKAAAGFLSLFGKKRHSKLLKALTFGRFRRKFGKDEDELAWVSANPDAFAEKDPLCDFDFTTRGYYDLFDLLQRIGRPSWAAGVRRDAPVLLVSGAMDPVGNCGKGVKVVYDRLLRAGLTDVQMKLYAGARHDLVHDEKCAETFFEDLAAWLDGRNL